MRLKLTYFVAWGWVPVFIAEFLLFKTTPAKILAALGAIGMFFAPLIVDLIESRRK